MRYEDQRALLLSELSREGIKDEAVLAAFAKVPREKYVLPEYSEYAYRNSPLPIELQQTISQPLMIAIMLQLLELQQKDTVLEIGTGSGYQSALLAEIVATVCTVERLDKLSLSAQKVLKSSGYKNIYFRIGDGSRGWEKAYPAHKEFSKIIVSAGASSIPNALVNQLAEGGRMVISVGHTQIQELYLVQRIDHKIVSSSCGACSFVPLICED